MVRDGIEGTGAKACATKCYSQLYLSLPQKRADEAENGGGGRDVQNRIQGAAVSVHVQGRDGGERGSNTWKQHIETTCKKTAHRNCTRRVDSA